MCFGDHVDVQKIVLLRYDGIRCSEIIIGEYSQKQCSDVAKCNLIRACWSGEMVSDYFATVPEPIRVRNVSYASGFRKSITSFVATYETNRH